MSIDLRLPPPIQIRISTVGIDAPHHGWAPGPSRRRKRKAKKPRRKK